MNTLLATSAHHTPLTTDAQLEDRVLALIGTAGHRQLWLLFLDADDELVPAAIPLDDLPREPDRAQADLLVGHLAGVLAQVDAEQLVLVWERPGPGRLADDPDSAWARAIAANCARRGVRLRAQLLSHTRGVTMLSPGDYAAGPPAPGAESGGRVSPSADGRQAALTPTAASSTAGTGC